MLRKNNILILLSLMVLMAVSNCASHTYNLNNYQVPIAFGKEEVRGEKARFFRIERKLTWLLFDLIKTENIDLTQTMQVELPNAKRIYNLRIESEEGPLDSFIRLISTGAQIWAFVSNRPVFFSRRTVVITGMVVE